WSHRGNASIYTLDHTYEKQFGNLKLSVEGVWQWGREGGQDLEAWAGSVTGEVPVSDRLTVFGGYSTASGGSSGNTSNTFNDLFPSDHRFNGIMDMQGWRNVDAVHIGAGYKVSDDMSLRATYHDFSLNDATDAWYNGRNGLQYGYVDPSGGSGSNVGSEIDLSLRWRLPNDLKLTAGLAVFDPGTFVETQSGGGSSQTWFYASLGWRH
ncbi:MAG: alginate export family protein, partial [Armatimonadetes bacterium]|nr:alginate export family protein [Armatimonadota bacterium]